MPRGLKALHAPLALADGLVGVFRTSVQIAVLVVLDPRYNLALRCVVALALLGDEDLWDVLAPLEELAEALLGSLRVPTALSQTIEDVSLVIHRPPEIGLLLVDGDADLIQRLGSTRPRTLASWLISLRLTAFPTPLTDRVVGDDEATDEEDLFSITRAQREAESQPDSMADALTREPVMLVEIGRG
jgi:hypothetical protein